MSVSIHADMYQGWFAEVIVNGKVLYSTPIFRSRKAARLAAQSWLVELEAAIIESRQGR